MNIALSRKKQAIKTREEQLLSTASHILMTEGFAAITMDRLAEELDTAKGTIYNHFPHREEVLLALSVQAVQKRQSMFDAASVSRGVPRERMLAVGIACEIYTRHYPAFFLAENNVRNTTIWEKCSEQRREILRVQEQRCMSLVSGIVRNAIADGDLILPDDGLKPEELTLSLWAMTWGSYLLDATSPSLRDIGIDSVHRSVRMGTTRLLDGFNWQPIWSPEDQQALRSKICRTVFASEQPLDDLG
jgi:AcrR family transcriptional regulator